MPDHSLDRVLAALGERAKELTCLYRVDEVLSRTGSDPDDAFHQLVEVLPAGWQYPDACVARLILGEKAWQSQRFIETPWKQSAPVVVEGERAGELTVGYTTAKSAADEGPFLKEERKLLTTIAERIGHALLQRRLAAGREGWRETAESLATGEPWRASVVLELIQRTDVQLLARLGRMMVHHLGSLGVAGAERLAGPGSGAGPPGTGLDDNRPLERRTAGEPVALAASAFALGVTHLGEQEVLACLQRWIKEDKAAELLGALESLDTSLSEIADALDRFIGLGVGEADLPLAFQVALRAGLIRRVFSDHLGFLAQGKRFVQLGDFPPVLARSVHGAKSHGTLGGKAAGLFIAGRVVERATEFAALLGQVRVPRTWHLASDGVLHFMRHNHLESTYARKYQEADQIRREYPHLVQVFKGGTFPPDIAKGLAAVLDDLEGRPIIVRSSSLLEDRSGSSFSGKYRSVFLANQGGTHERLRALEDAIAEVYASIFAPDPIEYRRERGLIDVHEEMGILIQGVVGTRVGRWFFPAFSGVAFSHNDFRWSPRLRREDGLVRLVPGLGTRAVDRLTDDYPVLLAPGQPGLRVNATVDEVLRYAPRKADVIDLDRNRLETVAVAEILRSAGSAYPLLPRLVSVVEGDRMRRPLLTELGDPAATLAVTFEGLAADTAFLPQIRALLRVLQESLGHPVDVEFAADGTHLYLLQCRAQSDRAAGAPGVIPRDLPADRVLFAANRHVSNGRIPDLTHIVYVDGPAYAAIGERERLLEVGRAVGRLNHLLPRRRFLLMGPGRWGSRGDLKLGVDVGYADINNAAALIEMAHRQGGSLPDLSFGTHFFQDLVEAEIRYLPLYPDEPAARFNEAFFRGAPSVLAELLPSFAHLDAVVRVIDVPRATGGLVARLRLNADLDEALGYLVEPAS